MKKHITILISILLACNFVFGQNIYWLSPSGNDNNDGKSEFSAFVSPEKAIATLQSGDQLWVKGGTYIVKTPLKPNKDGTQDQPILLFAVDGEKPVFDCDGNGGRGIDLQRNWWHIKGITIANAGNNGINIGGNNNIIEGCVTCYSNNDGISFAGSASNNLILNCDSYRNWEKDRDGNNGDGFSHKNGGGGNKFKGCRAWENSDDGWDVYGCNVDLLIEDCWAFRNGFNLFGYTGSWSGNGNGFKLGGDGGLEKNAENVVVNCVAFGNRSKGFDQNHNWEGQTIINSTAYNNEGSSGNFAFQEAPRGGVLGKHVMRNNLSYISLDFQKKFPNAKTHNLASGTESTTNSWDINVIFTDDMFVSLDTTLATTTRNEDYSLPETGLFRLKENNPAINNGTVQNAIRLGVGVIKYSGAAPDMGAFEFFEGSWITPEPAEPGKEPGGDDDDNPQKPDDSDVIISTLINVPSQFTISSNSQSVIWGPFNITSAEKAVFEMQSVGNSNGTIIMEYSKNGNGNWMQLGEQQKNGSTSWPKDAKNINLSNTPFCSTIYFRLTNNSDRNVNIRNLVITGKLAIGTGLNQIIPEKENIISESYYTISGAKTNTISKGIFIKKTVYENGITITSKIIK